MGRIHLAQTLVTAIAAAWPAATLAQPGATIVGVESPRPSDGKPAGGAPRLITLDQFDQAAQIAKLAAEKGLHELSMHAIRRALSNGPPINVESLPALGKPKPRRISSAGFTAAASSPDKINAQVSKALNSLAASWRRAPPEDVYQTLLAVVLPAGRPDEIFLYDALAGGPPQRRAEGGFTARVANGRIVRTVRTGVPPFGEAQWPVASRLLVEAASRAAKLGDLEQRISAIDHEHADFAATILLTQLALGRGRPDTTTCWPYLKRLAEHSPPDYARHLLHELMASIRGPEMPAEMVAWLEAKLEHETAQSRGLADDPTWLKVFFALARWRFAKGDVAQARRHLRRYAEFGLGGEVTEDERERYLTTRWLNVACEFIAEGLIDDALDALAAYVDGDEQVANEPLLTPAWLGLRRLLLEKLSAADRYRRLAAWTVPEGERRRLRFIGCFVPRDGRPSVFQTDVYRSWPDDEIASNFQLLVAAAREAGLLDDLKRRSAAYRTVDNVEAVALAVLMAEQTGDEEQATTHVERLLASRRAGLARSAATQEWISEAAYLLIRGCLRTVRLHQHGIALTELSEQRPWQWINRAYRRLLELEQAAAICRESGLGPPAATELAHWIPAHAGENWLASFDAHEVWAEDANCLRCVGGGNNCSLVLGCPLVGYGEISVELAPKRALGNLYYGGVSISPFGTYVNDRDSPATLLQERRPMRTIDLKPDVNRLTLHVEPETSLALSNGEILCDVPQPSAAAPWLMLSSSWSSGAGFRHLAIAGDWRVPREVELIADDRLTGWMSGFYEAQRSLWRVRLRPNNVESASAAPSAAAATSAPASVPAVAATRAVPVAGVPPRAFGAGRRVRSTTRGFTGGIPTSATYFSARSAPLGNSWSVKRGLLNGFTARGGGTSLPSPSRLTYFRPLRNGDELRYEFRCQPRMAVGSSYSLPPMMVHPALDRLTFLLEPDGVRLHWMTNHPDLEAGGLPLDNVADEPAARRGPARLPLVERDWNRVAIKLIDDEVLIELNGVLVFQRRLESTNDRLFSFFHYQDQTQALVRNVVLSGNWPEKLPSNEELFARLRPLSEAEHAAQAKLVDAEQFQSHQTEAKEKTR